MDGWIDDEARMISRLICEYIRSHTAVLEDYVRGEGVEDKKVKGKSSYPAASIDMSSGKFLLQLIGWILKDRRIGAMAGRSGEARRRAVGGRLVDNRRGDNLITAWNGQGIALLSLSGTSLNANHGAEGVDLFNNHLLHTLHAFLLFKGEVELRLAHWLVVGIVPDTEVGVVQCLLARDALGRIECEHLGQKVDRKGVRVGVKRRERNARLDRKGSNVILSPRRANASEGIFAGRTKIVKNLIQLVHVISSFEDGLSAKEFRENASDGPNINSGRVVCEAQHDLRSSVPPSGDVLRHESLVASGLGWRGSSSRRGITASQPEIADLEFAVGIDEQIAGLQVSVEDIGRVNVLETAECLI